MKLDNDPIPTSVIDFDNKKILVRSDKTESTKGKNIVIDDNAAPRMIKKKKSQVEVHNDNERKVQLAPRSKPTVKHLLDKYTSLKASNVFNRLGGNKGHKSRTQLRGHQRWRGKSYNQQPYFSMAPTSWSCRSAMYPQYHSQGFNSWATYPTGSAVYFQPDWVPLRHFFRPHMHEKRVRYNHRLRSRDAVNFQGSQLPRQGADGLKYTSDCKRIWVPVKRAEPKLIKL
jgi:hypothetical protein